MKSTQQKYTSNNYQLQKSIGNQKRTSLNIQKLKKQSINNLFYDSNLELQNNKTKNEHYQLCDIKQKHQQSVKNYTQILYFSNKIKKIIIKKLDETKKQSLPCTITRIMANGKISAAFDNHNNLWLLGMIFPQPINLFNVIKKKIIDAYLGQKGIIIKTINKFYVINWDKIDLPKEILNKIEINKKYSIYFQCWEQIVPYRSDAWFMFSSNKQCICERIFYHVFSEKLIIYPFGQEINIGEKIKGISASKTHTLCWTECGKIYSWGQRSLALGYTDFDDKIKQRQIQSAKFEVVSAIAGIHYSIALSSEGDLYQWGIKKIWSEKSRSFNQEFIFLPRKLQVKLNGQNQKVCCIKGFEDHFGILTFKNDLFFWGKTIPRKLMEFSGFYEQNLSTEPSSQNNMETKLNLSLPTLCKCSQIVKIVDFQIRQDYIFIVTASKQSNLKNYLTQKFWQRRLKNISNTVENYKVQKKEDKKSTSIGLSQLKVQKQQKCQSKQFKKNNFKLYQRHQSILQLLPSTEQDKQQKMQKLANKLNKKRFFCEDKITQAVNERLTKQEYFKKLKNQQKIYHQIMQGVPKSNFMSIQRNSKISTEHYMTPVRDQIDFIKFERKIKVQTFDLRYSSKDDERRPRTTFRNKKVGYKSAQNLLQLNINPLQSLKAEILLKNSLLEQQKKKKNDLYEKIKKRNKNQYSSAKNSRQVSPSHKSSSQVYNLKLKKVLSRKESLDDDFFQSTLNKLQRHSVEFKKKYVEQLTARKQKDLTKQMIKQTLLKYMIKNYVIKCLTNPIQFGRETKIKVFASNLKYNRVQRSMKRLFSTKRIKFDVQMLKQHMPKHYLKLIIIYRNYVKQWRQNKRNLLSKFCIEQLIRINSKNKIKVGLKSLKINVRNLQNIGSWVQISKRQKIKCLNQIWKKYLLIIFPLKPEFQGQYSVKDDPIKSFKQLYTQRIKFNPMLKIQNYLGVSPLFKIKMLRNCSLPYMQMILKNKEIQEIEFLRRKSLDNNVIKKKKQEKAQKIKFIKQESLQNFDLRFTVLNQNQYLLPYSKHSMIFKKPANFQLNISLRNLERWSRQQQNLLIFMFQKFIRSFHLEYEQKLFKYRRQMAVFIRENYSKICQRRSKYILQYNQLQNKKNQKQIRLKDRELRKVLCSIGCQGILNDDILPERHRILDQARQIKDAPQPPSMWMNFSMAEFKKVFRQYFQALQQKIQNKKNNHQSTIS